MELRIAVAGLGAIGIRHIGHIVKELNGGRVVAVTDNDDDHGIQVAAHHGITYYSSVEAMIGSGGVDALLVAAAEEERERYVLAGVRAGIPVFCEPPLARDVQGCWRIVEAEAAGGRRLVQVGSARGCSEEIQDWIDRSLAGAAGGLSAWDSYACLANPADMPECPQLYR